MAVSVVARLETGKQRNRGSILYRDRRSFFGETCRPILGPSLSPLESVSRFILWK